MKIIVENIVYKIVKIQFFAGGMALLRETRLAAYWASKFRAVQNSHGLRRRVTENKMRHLFHRIAIT